MTAEAICKPLWQRRDLPTHSERGAHRRVRANLCASGKQDQAGGTGDQRGRGDLGLREDIAETVHAAISGTFGEPGSTVPQVNHHPGRVTLGAEVRATLIVDRRPGDEAAHSEKFGRRRGNLTRQLGLPKV